METLPNGQSQETQGGVLKPDNKKKGLFEILAIVLIIAIFLGILNYFNILPLTNRFPNQLGWLPKKEVPTGTAQPKQYDNAIIAPTAIPTISLEQAKQTFLDYLPTILDYSLLATSSSDINLREDKGISNSVSGTWDTKDGKAITIFTVSPNGKEIIQLLIFFPYATTESISTKLAQLTIPKLFSITPKGKWACDTIPNTANYCENFWEEENGVRIGIVLKESLPLSETNKISISYCEHSQKRILYSWKSCISEFAKKG